MIRLFIYSLFILFVFSVYRANANQRDSVSHIMQKERYYNTKNYMFHYSKVISAANLWEGPSWSVMDFSVNQQHREFKAPQMFGNGNSIRFETESLQKLDSAGYTFYGKFSYQTNRDFNSEYNQSYLIPDNGSPLYLFTPVKGKWETQEYYFKGGASKRINNRLFVGASMSYSGDLFNRIIDVRNKQKNLSIELSPSLSYLLNDNNAISLAFGYNRKKAEPSNTNYYPRPGDDRNYWIYINKGLGTYERINVGYGLYFLTSAFDLSALWSRKINNDRLSFIFSYKSGNDIVQSKLNRPQTNTFYKLGKYSWSSFESDLVYTADIFGLKTINRLQFEMFEGLGYTHNDSQNQYQQSYKYTHNHISLASLLFPKTGFINFIDLKLDYYHKYALDFNYAQKYSYDNLLTNITLNVFNSSILWGKLSYQLSAIANVNLSYEHDPMSARTNIYTVNILNPTLSYNTMNYALVAPSIIWEKSIAGGYVFGFEVGGSIAKPITINYINSNTNLSTDSINNSVYFSFKFIF